MNETKPTGYDETTNKYFNFVCAALHSRSGATIDEQRFALLAKYHLVAPTGCSKMFAPINEQRFALLSKYHLVAPTTVSKLVAPLLTSMNCSLRNS